MSPTTPRLRPELKATAAEEAGIAYFDVSDPRTGSSLRLYDFEWLIAQKLDGRATFGDLASWAGGCFGFAPTAADLVVYAGKLDELGLLETEAKPAQESDSGLLPLDLEEGIVIDTEPEPVVTAKTPVGAPPPPAVPPPPATSLAAAPPAIPRAAPPMDMALAATLPVTPATKAPSKPQFTPVPMPAAKRGPTAITWVLGALLLAVSGIAVWMLWLAPMFAPVKVRVETVGKPQDVVQYYEGTGSVVRSQPTTLSFAAAGKVGDVVAPGTDVKAGMTLASLDVATPLEKELADVRDRAAFYTSQVDAATAKGKLSEAKKFEKKVAEKQKRIALLEGQVKSLRIVAPAGALVSEVLVGVGDDVAIGKPAVKLVDQQVMAELKLTAAESTALQAGDPASLVVANRVKAPITGRIRSVEAGTVRVELTDRHAAKPGDPVAMVRNRLSGVTPVPAAALSKTPGGGHQVYLVIGGKLQLRPVLVTEKNETLAYVSNGLAPGEQVVVSSTASLLPGAKAVAE